MIAYLLEAAIKVSSKREGIHVGSKWPSFTGMSGKSYGLVLWVSVKYVALIEWVVPSYVSMSVQNGDHTECNTPLKSVQLRT